MRPAPKSAPATSGGLWRERPAPPLPPAAIQAHAATGPPGRGVLGDRPPRGGLVGAEPIPRRRARAPPAGGRGVSAHRLLRRLTDRATAAAKTSPAPPVTGPQAPELIDHQTASETPELIDKEAL